MSETRFSRFHPALLFAFLLGAIGFSVMIRHPAYLVAGAVSALCLCWSVNGRKLWKTLLLLLPVFVVLSVINPLFNIMGEHPLFFTWWGSPYTAEALLYGVCLAGMVVTMMLWFSCYNALMTEEKFTYLFGNLIPSLALLLTMVFRLIPNLFRKTRQIAQARKGIGKGAQEGNGLRGRAEDGMTVLSALTSWALEGSVVTADSMNSRGYGVGKRTSFQRYRWSTEDIVTAVVLAVLFALTVIGLLRGSGQADFVPTLRIAPPDWGVAAYFLFLMTPTFLNWKEKLTWNILRSRI